MCGVKSSFLGGPSTNLAVYMHLTQKLPVPHSRAARVSRYPTMRLSGEGRLVPSRLLNASWISVTNPLINDSNFFVNPQLVSWNDVFVFFPISRTARIPTVLEIYQLRRPTYHHAIALGLSVRAVPVEGVIVVAHSPIILPGVGSFHLCIAAHGYSSHAGVVSADHVFREPVWAVGLK